MEVERCLSPEPDLRKRDLHWTGSDSANSIRNAVLRYGRASMSFDMFESPDRYQWFPCSCSADGGIAFRHHYGTDIVIGEPLVEEGRVREAFKEFLDARPRGRCVTGFSSPESFMEAAVVLGAAALQITVEIEFNPQTWDPNGPTRAKLRQNVRRLTRLGMKAMEVPTDQPTFDNGFRLGAEELVSDWLSRVIKRPGHFHDVNLWSEWQHKRFFALPDPEEKDHYLALLVARPIFEKKGYYLSAMRSSGAPIGANELVIMKAIEIFREEGVEHLAFGPQTQPSPGNFVNSTAMSRMVLGRLYGLVSKGQGYLNTNRFFRKFGFDQTRGSYMIVWPGRTWLRPMLAVARTVKAFPLLMG